LRALFARTTPRKDWQKGCSGTIRVTAAPSQPGKDRDDALVLGLCLEYLGLHLHHSQLENLGQVTRLQNGDSLSARWKLLQWIRCFW